jgi:hypothetical protein
MAICGYWQQIFNILISKNIEMEANSSSSASRAVSGRAPRTGDKEKLDDKNKVHTNYFPSRPAHSQLHFIADAVRTPSKHAI